MATAKKSTSKSAPKSKKDGAVKINRIGILLDASGSMGHLQSAVRQRLKQLIEGIHSSTPAGQQAQFSVFTFSTPDSFRTLFLNSPFNPVGVDQAASQYAAVGSSTALLDSIADAVAAMDISTDDRADITKLLYVVTDGQDNSSRNYTAGSFVQGGRSSNLVKSFKSVIDGLDDRWTLGVMVPDNNGKRLMEGFGVPSSNIEVWNPNTVQGLETATAAIAASYGTYANDRSAGITRSASLFRPDTSTLSKTDVKKTLDKVDGSVFFAQKDYRIDEFVEKNTGAPYVKGSAFYELTKSELVQPYKEVVLVDKTSGEKFGGSEARDLIGLSSSNQRVSIGQHGRWHIFIQSTSLNRKIPSGTRVFVKGV